ncbi:MAG TPA: dihydropteroate synthase, partial [Chloroflexia bacterium]
MTSNHNTTYNARVITHDPAVIASELGLVGVQKPGQKIIAAKSDSLVVKLDNLPCVAANVLKQEMLARGGDCAVHQDCLTLERDTTSVLLTGTREQYDSLVGKLQQQGFDLPVASRQIADLLANLDTQRGPLQVGRHTLPRGER